MENKMYQFEEKSEWLKNLEEELHEDLKDLEDNETDVNYFIAREYTGVNVAVTDKVKDNRKVRKANRLEALLYEDLERIKDAWNDSGIAPGYHQKMQNKLRREWPVLAAALDRALKDEQQW